MSRLLPQSFFARETLVVAEALLGQQLRHGSVVLRIAEVEAYCGPQDSACHTRMGRTKRNAPMWGPPGHAYVYLCYGLHFMLNIVTDRLGAGAAVLIRACEPVQGLARVRARRGRLEGPTLLNGPAKVAQALGIDTSFSGHRLYTKAGLSLHEGEPPAAIIRGRRIGIGYARPEHQRAPWRLAIADCPWVGHRKTLTR
jgi:DNA-3-methyladenine glycosylase